MLTRTSFSVKAIHVKNDFCDTIKQELIDMCCSLGSIVVENVQDATHIVCIKRNPNLKRQYFVVCFFLYTVFITVECTMGIRFI